MNPLGKMMIPGFGQIYLDNILTNRIGNIGMRKIVAYVALTFGQLLAYDTTAQTLPAIYDKLV